MEKVKTSSDRFVEQELSAWVNSLSNREYELLTILRDQVRQQAFDEVYDLCLNSQIAKMVEPQPRLSFRLVKARSFRLLVIPE